MWGSIQLFLLLGTLSVSLLFGVKNLPQFAVYSELIWLVCYCTTAVLGSFIDSPAVLSFPFVILVLTAVEAVIVWTLITSTRGQI